MFHGNLFYGNSWEAFWSRQCENSESHDFHMFVQSRVAMSRPRSLIRNMSGNIIDAHSP